MKFSVHFFVITDNFFWDSMFNSFIVSPRSFFFFGHCNARDYLGVLSYIYFKKILEHIVNRALRSSFTHVLFVPGLQMRKCSP